MLLEHIKGTSTDAELEAEYIKLAEETNKLLDQMNVVLEVMDWGGIADRLAGEKPAMQDEMPQDEKMPRPGQVDPGEDMEKTMSAMEQVIKQMKAAKRGMGLVNKLGSSSSRTMNKSRVMGNMNKIRANLRRVEKMLVAQAA